MAELRQLDIYLASIKKKGNYVVYVNENRKLCYLELEIDVDTNSLYCKFPECAFVVGIIKDATFWDVKDNTKCYPVTPKEAYFMQSGTFYFEYLETHDFRKPESYFSL